MKYRSFPVRVRPIMVGFCIMESTISTNDTPVDIRNFRLVG